ncbi:Kinesin light chain 3 [Blyttiomyces sp. JEL0837]|nr:Kinesin light chain 3 [Blyttiomyces sp. JEL0837]
MLSEMEKSNHTQVPATTSAKKEKAAIVIPPSNESLPSDPLPKGEDVPVVVPVAAEKDDSVAVMIKLPDPLIVASKPSITPKRALVVPKIATEPLAITTNGINLEYLHQLIQACGGRSAIGDMTTSAFVDTIIKPITTSKDGEAKQMTFCDYLSTQGRHDAIQPADWFVVHAWEYKFIDLMDSLTAFFKDDERQDAKDIYVWIDIFCITQSETSRDSVDRQSYEWFERSLSTAINTIKNVVMVIQPWNDPKTFKRAWCIFEMYITNRNRNNCKFRVAMTPTEFRKMLDRLADDSDSSYEAMLSRVNTEPSEATNSHDKEMMFKFINEATSFVDMDRIAFKMYSHAITKRLKEDEKRAEGSRDHVQLMWAHFRLAQFYLALGNTAEAEDMADSCYELGKEECGNDNVNTLRAQMFLARVYLTRKDAEKSLAGETLAIDVYKKMSNVLGPNHDHTLKAMLVLAQVHINAANYQRAKNILEECLAKREKTSGRLHPSTIRVLRLLAVAWDNYGEPEKAENVMLDCLNRWEEVVGKDHFEYLDCQLSLGTICRFSGRFEDAVTRVKIGLDGFLRLFTKYHHKTVQALKELAQTYVLMGKTVEAEELLQDAYVTLQKTPMSMEEKDELNISCLHKLAALNTRLGRLDKALEYTLLVCDKMREVYGKDHDAVVMSTHTLANIYREMGRHEEALELLLELRDRTMVKFGDDNQYTMAVSISLGRLYNQMGDFDRSVATLKPCVDACKNAFGDEHFMTTKAEADLKRSMAKKKIVDKH